MYLPVFFQCTYQCTYLCPSNVLTNVPTYVLPIKRYTDQKMDIFEVVGLRDGGPAGSWQPADDLSSNPAEVYSSFRYENIKNSQKE